MDARDKEKATELIEKLDDFAFDEEHGYTEDEYANCAEDMYSEESYYLCMADPCYSKEELDARYTLSYRAYKLGFMRATGQIPPAEIYPAV